MLGACKKAQRGYSLEYPEEKMVRLMVDLYTAEAMAGKFKVADRDSVKALFAERVYEMHDLSKFQIDSMLAIINQDHYSAQALQRKVVDRLRHIEERILPNKHGIAKDTSEAVELPSSKEEDK